MSKPQKFITEHSYQRLISRSSAASFFWREKVYEVVGNYRRWRQLSTVDAAPNYILLQRRRVQRLVAQAFVEYRRAQAQARIITELRALLPHSVSGVEAAQIAAISASLPKTPWDAPVSGVQIRQKK